MLTDFLGYLNDLDMRDYIELASENVLVANSEAVLALKNFCRGIEEILENTPQCGVPKRVAKLLPDLLAVPELLASVQCQSPPGSYGRNSVFISPQDMFSVVAMVWPPGVTTPIHDHRDWCALGVYKGKIEETYYAPASEASDCTRAIPQNTGCHAPGAITHTSVDRCNIHKIHNSTDAVAISVHVYGGNCEKLGPNLDRVYSI